jgi:hypothetical protein
MIASVSAREERVNLLTISGPYVCELDEGDYATTVKTQIAATKTTRTKTTTRTTSKLKGNETNPEK